MQYGIAFAPLVPLPVIWIGLAAIVVISALLLYSRARADPCAAAADHDQQQRHDRRNRDAGPKNLGGYQRREGDSETHARSYCPSRSSSAGTCT